MIKKWRVELPLLVMGIFMLALSGCGDGGEGTAVSQPTSQPQIATATLPAGLVMLGYKQVVQAGGGSNTGYVWTVSSGTLPPGVTLVGDTPNATLRGLPTAAGTFSFTLRVQDSNGYVGTQALAIQVNPAMIRAVAGTGVAGFSGDGGLATAAQFNTPAGVLADSVGNILIVDRGNHRVRRIDAVTGFVSTVAGTGVGGFNGDNQIASLTQFNFPTGLALDAGNNWLVTEQGNNRLRRVARTTQIVTTIAGTGTAGFNGDNVAATVAQVNVPSGVAVDQAGHIFIADTFNHRVRRVDAVTGEITTVAGNGSAGPLGDGASATAAQLNFPLDVAVDGAGNVLIADSFNNRVRRVDAITGVITTVAGNGIAGYAGDGAAATAAQLDFPVGIALDADQDILIADGNNHAVRLVNRTSGAIATIAGTGIAGYNGDNQAAATALLDSPYRLAVEPSGTVLLTEAGGMRVRRIGQ
jgi:hypothetical protein